MVGFIDTFKKHRAKPEITLDEYTKTMKLELGKSINHRKKIYLDTNYWLELRDVLLERQKNKTFENILNILKSGVEKEKIICPISDETFYEILLQNDPKTLKQTVDLIDELSKGVSIISSEERIKFEILYFLRYFLNGKNSIHDPEIFVWSKISYIYGLTHPSSTPFHSEEKLVIQKAFFDQMWSLTFADVVQVMGIEEIIKMPRHNDISCDLNIRKVEFAHENKSFKQLFLSEIAGALDFYKEPLKEATIYLFEKEKGYKPSQTEVEEASPELLVNAIYNLFKLNKLGVFFPSLIIEAGLYASVRQDIKRKFNKNDMSDFRHARTAVSYYDSFFTEHSLRDLVTRSNLSFDKKYNCKVLSNPSEVEEYLEKIIS